MMDNRISEDRLAEAERLIADIYRFMGGGAETDHALWWTTKQYCKKYSVPESTEFSIPGYRVTHDE